MNSVAYHNLPVIGPLLSELNIQSRDDLFALNLADLADKPWVGRTKVSALLNLIRNEKLAAEATRPTAFTSDLTTKCAPYAHLQVTKCFGQVNPRVVPKLEKYKIETVADLIKFYENVNVLAESNYGRKTHDWIRESLEQLAEHGPIRMVFGTNAPPSTAEECATMFLNVVENPQHRDAFDKYFIHDFTLDQVGQTWSPVVTRERIRQVIDIYINRCRDSWGSTAASILDPLVKQANAQSGVILLKTALDLTGSKYSWHLDLVARIANLELLLPRGRREGLITLLDRDELEALASECSSVIEDTLETTNLSTEAHKALLEYGINFGTEVNGILPILTSVTYNGDYIYGTRRKIHMLYVETLRKNGRPMTGQQLAEVMKVNYPDINCTPHTAITQLRRSNAIYKTDDNCFAHESHFKFDINQLKQLAKEAYKLVPRNGQAVNVRRLINELSARTSAPPDLSPYTLRDAMLKIGNLRSWRAGCDIAYLCDGTNRTSIMEFLNEIAPTLNQPFTLAELVDNVCKISGYLTESVNLQTHNCTEIVMIGYTQYLSTQVIEKDPAKFAALVKIASALVPERGVTTSQHMARNPTSFKQLVKKYGDGVVWGLAKLDNTISTRIRGRVAFRSSYASLWDAFTDDPRWTLGATFSDEELRRHISDIFDIKATGYSYYLLKDALSNGQVYKDSVDTYVDVSKMASNI